MEDHTLIALGIGGVVLGVIIGTTIVVQMLKALRVVVDTNEVHIVQSAKTTVSYGKDTSNGNCYYTWPSWIPRFGVTVSALPTNNFILPLNDYEAYDKGRLPFKLDIRAFFRISDSNTAAQRVASFDELQKQLLEILKGSLRSILASSELEVIMQGRSTFGELFTKEVNEHLTEWGVQTVRNVELMDVRDSDGHHVISNIMAKKQSQIEMESRTEVAKNMRSAEIAEVEANRDVSLQKQEAEQRIGLRTVENRQAVQLATETANQVITEQQKLTKTKQMAVFEVEQVRTAEIKKTVTVRDAEAKLEQQTREAEAVRVQGQAKADAEKALQLAPIQAQITLAAEIGENEGYQKYLISIRQIEATQKVGEEQAKALAQAEINVIANSASPSEGLHDVRELFSAKGGNKIGAMVEGFMQTKAGKTLGEKFTQ